MGPKEEGRTFLIDTEAVGSLVVFQPRHRITQRKIVSARGQRGRIPKFLFLTLKIKSESETVEGLFLYRSEAGINLLGRDLAIKPSLGLRIEEGQVREVMAFLTGRRENN